jgi:hypothetical protein
MSALFDSRSDLVVRSGFQALRAVYLLELERIEHGIPAGPLRLASGLTSATSRGRLFEVAADPVFVPWQAQAARVIVGADSPQRDQVLHMADEAQVGRRWRRAVQLYGWLMLTSREADNAWQWSTRHLRALRRDVYANQG